MAERGVGEIETGSTASTFVIDRPCLPTDDLFDANYPCEIKQIDHYGTPTAHLLCGPHGKAVGHVR